MPRTKGAKGKKTLAKEMGMNLEEYEKYLLGKKIISDNKFPLSPVPKNNKDLKKEEEKIDNKIISNPPKLNSEVITSPEENPVNLKNFSEKISKKYKREKEVIYCERCHKPITGYIPTKINLISITTFAEYRRQTESDKGRVLLCESCLRELNTVVDKFLYNEGKGIPLKYGQEKYLEKDFDLNYE